MDPWDLGGSLSSCQISPSSVSTPPGFVGLMLAGVWGLSGFAPPPVLVGDIFLFVAHTRLFVADSLVVVLSLLLLLWVALSKLLLSSEVFQLCIVLGLVGFEAV